MNIKEELKKFVKKIIEEDVEEVKEKKLENIECKIQKEIKKSTVIIKNEILELKNEIEKNNKESETLKKDIFILNKELKKKNQLLINILQNYFIINTFNLNDENKEIFNLVLKKEKYLLSKDGLECLAEIGEEFNPKYHEVLNKDLEKKDSYKIEKIIEQGYKQNNEVLKFAKVIIK